MSAHVLLSLINELRKRDKLRGFLIIKFNNTRARMLDSIYRMILRFLYNLNSAAKNVIILFFMYATLL